MEKITGKDIFNGTFDFFEWSAPYYNDIVSLARFLTAFDCKGKCLSGINIIGHVGGSSRGDVDYYILKNAGLKFKEGENWWEVYPYMDEIRHPWEVHANEPVQFQFSDGSTLEILPMEDGVTRVGINTIPKDIRNGSSYNNFDANDFFGEFLGKELTSIQVRIVQDSITTYSKASFKFDYFKPNTSTKYYIDLSFEESSKLSIEFDWTSKYYVSAQIGNNNGRNIQNSRIKRAFLGSDYVPIINGRTSNGEFWIGPELPEDLFVDRYGISIDELDIRDYLSVLLYKYYDPAIQKKDYEDQYVEKRFDWYGSNYYSAELMRKILSDLENISDLLMNDYGNDSLDEVKEKLNWTRYTEKHKDELTEDELNELRKKDIPVALDFYERFRKWAERVLEIPGCKGIFFTGP